MTITQKIRFMTLSLLALLTISGLAGCGARASVVQAPAGMKVGGPLTPTQVQAIQQKRAAQ